jgi:squalene cyclase
MNEIRAIFTNKANSALDALVAKYNLEESPEESIKKAEEYLLNSQKEDGGWENISSTSWAIQVLSLNESIMTRLKKELNL